LTEFDNIRIHQKLDPARQRQAREYARIRRYLGGTDLALIAIVLVVLVFGEMSARLAGVVSLPAVAAAVIYLIVLLLAYGLFSAPLGYYRGLVLPRRYGLSRQSFTDWLADMLKAGALAAMLAIGMVAAIYWLMSILPGAWWLAAWGLVVLVSLVLSVLAPVIIIPLFFKMKPLADGELRQRLERLAERAGVTVGGIYNIEFSRKGTMANAAMMGAGRTKRIVLSDTLLDQYSLPEIEVVMAHEMGHNRHRDVLRLFVVQAAILLLTFYATSLIFEASIGPLDYTGLTDVSALPLLILIFGVTSLLLSLVGTSYERHVEAAADDYALELIRDPDSFITVMTRLTDQNLAEAEPNRLLEILFHDHPSYRSRVNMARYYAACRNRR
jgi:STE24 endopeptidase